ncbi:unnamed protein product [Strongylus vulgaris]|uniref:Tyrosine-protein phosphatase domain-containing protein n=1 Tax=Strongylus vulgaris TaxID=40348 RepID=A0A3P7I6V8_STRVU|nr:unnamed protein product [Strongylus vulgaris]
MLSVPVSILLLLWNLDGSGNFRIHSWTSGYIYSIYRYDDILCMDATRVRLKARSENDDYIHANWITMPDNQKYICTQGPLAETVEDFWHMVFTERSNVVVMLCNFVEG